MIYVYDMDLKFELTCTTPSISRNLQFITSSECFKKSSTETQKIVGSFNEKIIFNISLRLRINGTHVLTMLQSKLRICILYIYLRVSYVSICLLFSVNPLTQ